MKDNLKSTALNAGFYQTLFERQQGIDPVPANREISEWAVKLLNVLFPERLSSADYSLNEISRFFVASEKNLMRLLDATKACEECRNEDIIRDFYQVLPELYRRMKTDLQATLDGDPAASNEFEIIRSYPGFFAMAIYRIAHQLLILGVPMVPRILTEFAHGETGIDIHPGANIGEYLFIDHGTGIVIGETTTIGDHVKLYQGVTLGALSVEKYMANTKRHPTIGNDVIIYSGATILGGETIIGEKSIIGGNVWLTKSIPANSIVYHQSAMKVISQEKKDKWEV